MSTSVLKRPASGRGKDVDPLDEIKFDQAASGLLEGASRLGFRDKAEKRIEEAMHLMRQSRHVSLKPLLPLLLNLKGKPYTLDRHFPFEPFFRTRTARRTLLISGRQVAKSSSLASRAIVHSNCVPFYSTLFIGPLYETIRKFSQNYVRPFIETSPLKHLLVSSKTVNSVLQRTFLNHSQLLFSFAYLDAERTRGISADETDYDEIQNLDKDFIPIIRETMSGSEYGGIERYAGTPKSMENTIQKLKQDSSQAEWVIPCHRCKFQNIPAKNQHLEKMIGPYRDDISEQKPAVICAQCRRYIYPQLGRWVHAFGERRWKFAGYHIPQIIIPTHYANPEKWQALLDKFAGKGNTPIHVFWNEVCGESSESGSRLVTLGELENAADLPWTRNTDDAKKHIHDGYIYRVLSCDWGGGGEDEVSYTKMAVLGILPNGKIHVLWGMQSLTPHDHVREARLAIAALHQFECHALVHDYTGAGSLRETLITHAGWPISRIIPVAYQRAAAGNIMTFHEQTAQHPRDYWIVDKSRSLQLTCEYIKTKWLRFFKFDYEDADNPGLVCDFLALVDEKTESRTGRDLYTIIRDPTLSDDFAQAVNIGCCALWQMTKWPDLSLVRTDLKVTQELLNAIHPPDHLAWTDIQI